MSKPSNYYLEEAENELENIVYGDTDSIFIHVENAANTRILKDYNKDISEVPEKDIISVIDGISEIITDEINNKQLKDFGQLFGIGDEYNEMIFKSEITASKGYWLGVKKKYALKVVSIEGKAVNDYDVKGLEMRRSDYSAWSKEMLTELVYELILDNNAKISNIVEFASRKKDECMKLINRGYRDISKAVNFNKSVENYKAVTKEGKQSLPGHIKAMLAYNYIMGEEINRQGTKAYLFYITGINKSLAPKNVVKNWDRMIEEKQPGDYKAVAIPRVLGSLPEYFIPDMDKMLDMNFIKRMSNILDPLDVKIDSGEVKENLDINF